MEHSSSYQNLDLPISDYPYLIHFRCQHEDFHLHELDSLLILFGINPKEAYDASRYNPQVPFLQANFPSTELAITVCQRSVLIKSIYELWGIGTNMVTASDCVMQEHTKELRAKYKDAPWCVHVDAFGVKLKQHEINEWREEFMSSPLRKLFEGPVVISKEETNQFFIVLNYGTNLVSALMDDRKAKFGEEQYLTRRELKRKKRKEFKERTHVPEELEQARKAARDAKERNKEQSREKLAQHAEYMKTKRAELIHGSLMHYFFGRLLACGCIDLVDQYNLKKRAFIGPTSMDVELAFIMANQALVRPGSLVLDPFVGTGSILIPATIFGAECHGADIDIRILKGKDNTTLFDSFDQYSLKHPDILRMDFSPIGRNMRPIPGGLYDAIICDPPYGIRAGARKSGVDERKRKPRPFQEVMRPDHIPATQNYATVDVMVDLLDSAAQLLKKDGRLVYILPFIRAQYCIEIIPVHPCFTMVGNSEQVIQYPYARRFITMVKTSEYDLSKRDEYMTFTKTRLENAETAISRIRELTHVNNNKNQSQ